MSDQGECTSLLPTTDRRRAIEMLGAESFIVGKFDIDKRPDGTRGFKVERRVYFHDNDTCDSAGYMKEQKDALHKMDVVKVGFSGHPYVEVQFDRKYDCKYDGMVHARFEIMQTQYNGTSKFIEGKFIEGTYWEFYYIKNNKKKLYNGYFFNEEKGIPMFLAQTNTKCVLM